MRLIDADLLEDQFGISDEDLVALDEIRHAPTVDAVPVVRCKNCRYFKLYKCRMGYSSHDDFCSYGKRKD